MHSSLDLITNIFSKEEKDLYFTLSKYQQQKFEKIILKRYNLAGRDGLTGLYNRNSLDFILENILNEIYRTEFDKKKAFNFNLIFFDIDNFKKINDSFGHKIGDDILKNYSKLLIKEKKRKFDNIFRYGGEEFVYLLEDSNLNYGIEFTKKIKKKLEDEIKIIKINSNIKGINLKEFNEKNLNLKFEIISNITSSFGILNFRESINQNLYKKYNSKEILNLSDSAMYNSKKSGKNCISYIKEEKIINL